MTAMGSLYMSVMPPDFITTFARKWSNLFHGSNDDTHSGYYAEQQGGNTI